MSSAITNISLNRATFSNVSIDNLSYINFFYGNNGSGKSSIARAIDENDGITWADGQKRSDYDVMVFDRKFIKGNFENYSNLKGVFTIGAENVESKRIIAKLTEKKKEKAAERDIAREKYILKTEEINNSLTEFQNTCFSKTAAVRKRFEKCLVGKKTKKGFAASVLTENAPTYHDPDELFRLYDVVFDNLSRAYPEFKRVGFRTAYNSLPGRSLLDKVIVSSSDTPFASFMKALGVTASAWVRDGHMHYSAAAGGKCPYCQQKLPDTFESDITACFDAQYQQNIKYLEQFKTMYESETAEIVSVLKSNLNDVPSSIDLQSYLEKTALLESIFKVNNQRISEKCKEPSSAINLDSTDMLISEINDAIDKFNEDIKENNKAVYAKKYGKEKCKTELMQHLAFILTDEVIKYRNQIGIINKEISDLVDHGKQLNQEIYDLSLQISELNKRNVSTETAIDSINRVLHESGFQGFRIHAKDGIENVYEIIRNDGSIAENLSEGEQNFIAFLYFSQLVRGSSTNEEVKEKIVVIDDPVSGMDNTALFTVSAIVREIIRNCLNNTKNSVSNIQEAYIKQLFILTHNVQFHQEITYDQIGNYKYISFYLIEKSNNNSAVKLCKRQNHDAPSAEENYNPVRNSYAALWDELNDLRATIPAVNVMRRILEYYFMQLCGYESSVLRELILGNMQSSKDPMITIEGNNSDMTYYQLASSLTAYIGSSNDIGSNPNYVEDRGSADDYKVVFKMIFERLGHGQHFNMMTNNAKR